MRRPSQSVTSPPAIGGEAVGRASGAARRGRAGAAERAQRSDGSRTGRMEQPEGAAAALGAQPRANGCSGAAHGGLRNGYVRGLPAPNTQVCAAGALRPPGRASTGAEGRGGGRPSRGLRWRAGRVGSPAAQPGAVPGALFQASVAASSLGASRRCPRRRDGLRRRGSLQPPLRPWPAGSGEPPLPQCGCWGVGRNLAGGRGSGLCGAPLPPSLPPPLAPLSPPRPLPGEGGQRLGDGPAPGGRAWGVLVSQAGNFQWNFKAPKALL